MSFSSLYLYFNAKNVRRKDTCKHKEGYVCNYPSSYILLRNSKVGNMYKSVVTDGIFINISLCLSQQGVPNKVHIPPIFYS